LDAALVAEGSFEPDGALEGVAAAMPARWYDAVTATWESGIFRLRASSRIVIAVQDREIVGQCGVAACRERGKAAFDGEMPRLAMLEPPCRFAVDHKCRANARIAVATSRGEGGAGSGANSFEI
jgi:hypothetical protein